MDKFDVANSLASGWVVDFERLPRVTMNKLCTISLFFSSCVLGMECISMETCLIVDKQPRFKLRDVHFSDDMPETIDRLISDGE
jgi:hypothetical protein